MGYLHVDFRAIQSSRREGNPCGDWTACERGTEGTTFVLADGAGSGVRAHLAARFVISRLMEKLRHGASMQRAFQTVTATLDGNRGTGMPWAAFVLGRVMTSGNATLLTYEMPPPVLVARRHANVLPPRSLAPGRALVGEVHCHLVAGDNLLLASDGITQAGMGRGLRFGWGVEGLCREANLLLAGGRAVADLPASLREKARRLQGGELKDDATLALAACREGVIVNILTGPPADAEHDAEVVNAFLEAPGAKVVCGGTTAGIVAREMGTTAAVDSKSLAPFTPPRYRIDGIDLATEGAICLNQLYNILDEDRPAFESRSAVSDLHDLLRGADRVRFLVGHAANAANDTTTARQQGILQRPQIVPLLAEKLRAAGKLVEIERL